MYVCSRECETSFILFPVLICIPISSTRKIINNNFHLTQFLSNFSVCNKNGQTAEDLAWSCGFPECAMFLTMIKCMQMAKSSGEHPEHDPLAPVPRQN